MAAQQQSIRRVGNSVLIRALLSGKRHKVDLQDAMAAWLRDLKRRGAFIADLIALSVALLPGPVVFWGGASKWRGRQKLISD
jgi:hypothetical protein